MPGVRMPLGLGEAPKHYNAKVHGPYNPAVYYGPKDTPLSEVKVGELPAWLMRRSKNPIDWTRAAGRAYSRYMQNWVYVRKGGIAPFFHFAAMWCGLFYVMNHKKHYAPHSNAKIHW